MNKQEFFARLGKGLSCLPQEDKNERLIFYREMIDDRIEDGLSEEEAIHAIGNVDDIIAQIIADTPLVKIVKERVTPKKNISVLTIVLLSLGSPLWISLLIAIFAVILSLYASFWAVIISLWAVFVSVIGSALGAVLSGIIFVCIGHVPTGIATIGAGIFLAGLSIFIFYGCKASTKGILVLTKKFALWIKNCFIKKEEA